MSDTIKSQVRYPRALHAALKREAERDARSLNSVVLKALRVFVDTLEPADRADLNTTIKRLQKNRTVERAAKKGTW
jgi:hypothetical protein